MNKGKFNQYMYYGIIAIISLLTLFIVPMLGSEIGLKWVLPNTVAGWVVYVVSNIISTVLNLLMFHSFIKQGKVNILEEPKYVTARDIIQKITEENTKGVIPLSPQQWHRKEYRTKAISLAIFTLLGTVGFAQAILTFDIVKLLAQVICLISGLIFGFIEMKSVEEYWTVDYYEYALYLQKQSEAQKKAVLEQEKLKQCTKPTEVINEPSTAQNSSDINVSEKETT